MPSFSPVLYLPKTYAICRNYDYVSLVVSYSTTSDITESVHYECKDILFYNNYCIYQNEIKAFDQAQSVLNL